MGATISNMFENFNLDANDSLFPGTKFIATDNNTYIFLGYSTDMNNLICIKSDKIYNDYKQYVFSHNDIKQIIYISKPIENKNHTNFMFA